MFNEKLLPEKVRDISPYQVDRNEYEIRLDANESYIDFPEEQRAEIEQILKNQSFNRYPDCEAEKLCKAFADFYGIDEQNVIAGNGSDEIISLLMSCFLDKGKKVAVFSPEFSMYSFYATLAEQQTVVIPKKEDLHIDFELTQSVLQQQKPSLVIFSNPCNPTGVLESKQKLKELILQNPDTIFISDEAYMDFAPDTQKDSFLYETADYPNLCVLKTLSKAFGCAALRVGFLVGDKVSREAFFKVKSPYNLNSLSQSFACAVLENKQNAKNRTQSIVECKKYLEKGLKKLENKDFEIVNSSANFILVKTKRAREIYESLLKNKISIRCFDFGGGALRITAGSKQQTDKLLQKLKECI